MDQCVVIDVNDVAKRCRLRVGHLDCGSFCVDEPQKARISYWYDAQEEWVVDFGITRRNFGPDPFETKASVRLHVSSPPLGGTRWWFVCPMRGCRVAKLYLPPWSDRLGSRDAHGLSYPDQRLSRFDRRLARVRSIRAQCGGGPNLLEPFPDRPKGMHAKRYDRLWDADAEAMQRYLSLLASRLPRLPDGSPRAPGPGESRR